MTHSNLTFLSLPNEILVMIAENCRLSDVSRLARTCQRINALSTVALYAKATTDNLEVALFLGILNETPKTVLAALRAGADPDTKWEPIAHADSIRGNLTSLFDAGHSWRDILHKGMISDDSESENSPSSPVLHWSPIHFAASSGNMEILDILLAHNAELNSGCLGVCDCDRDGCYLRGLCYDEVARRNVATLSHSTFHVAICQGHLDIVKALHARHASTNSDSLSETSQNESSRPGLPHLHVACALGHVSIVDWLLNECPCLDVEALDRALHSPLDYAYANSNWECLELLLGKGANLDRTSKLCGFDQSIFYHAVSYGRLEDAINLMKRGADESCPDLDIGPTQHRSEKPSVLHRLCATSWDRTGSRAPRSAYQAIQGKLDPDQSRQGMLLLNHFLSLGMNPDESFQGRTSLGAAGAIGNADAVERLIAFGANINGSPNCNRTPLSWACSNMHNIRSKRGILALLEAGALMSVPGSKEDDRTWPNEDLFDPRTHGEQESPLQWAIINRLIDMGVNPANSARFLSPFLRLLWFNRPHAFRKIAARCGPEMFSGHWESFWKHLRQEPAWYDLVEFLLDFDTSGEFRRCIEANPV